MRRQKVIYENEYRDLPINTNKEKGLGCLSSSLQSYREKLEYMKDKHSKVQQVRFDLRYPSDNSVPCAEHVKTAGTCNRKRPPKTTENGHLVHSDRGHFSEILAPAGRFRLYCS